MTAAAYNKAGSTGADGNARNEHVQIAPTYAGKNYAPEIRRPVQVVFMGLLVVVLLGTMLVQIILLGPVLLIMMMPVMTLVKLVLLIEMLWELVMLPLELLLELLPGMRNKPVKLVLTGRQLG